MSKKEEKAFNSAKEVIRTYFPSQIDNKSPEQREGYGSATEVFVEKIVTEFGAGLRKGLRR